MFIKTVKRRDSGCQPSNDNKSANFNQCGFNDETLDTSIILNWLACVECYNRHGIHYNKHLYHVYIIKKVICVKIIYFNYFFGST